MWKLYSTLGRESYRPCGSAVCHSPAPTRRKGHSYLQSETHKTKLVPVMVSSFKTVKSRCVKYHLNQQPSDLQPWQLWLEGNQHHRGSSETFSNSEGIISINMRSESTWNHKTLKRAHTYYLSIGNMISFSLFLLIQKFTNICMF